MRIALGIGRHRARGEVNIGRDDVGAVAQPAVSGTLDQELTGADGKTEASELPISRGAEGALDRLGEADSARRDHAIFSFRRDETC